MYVAFSVVGEKQYSRAFETMAGEASDLSEPFARIGRSLLSSVHEQFRTEGAHGLGGKWQPLSAPYATWKRQQVGDQPILVFTGKMRAAMIDPRSLMVSPRRLVYEPDAPSYAIRHQLGDPPFLPERKIVALPGNVRRGFDRVFAEWLNDLRHRPIGVSL